jgi:hypothetical protein
VLWGGQHPERGKFDASLNDFFRVFKGTEGSEDAAEGSGYALGDHLGGWDFGMFLEFEPVKFKIYRQFPLETRDNLKLKSYMDAITGISIDFDESLNTPVQNITYEYLYTKYQDGPRRLNTFGEDDKLCIDYSGACSDRYRGNENYYNHGQYETGWVYNYRTIGNPLFIVSDSNRGVLNNRLIAHHLGVELKLSKLKLLSKATFSRNYGKRWNNRIPDLGESEIFTPSVDQWSFIVTGEMPVEIKSYNTTLSLSMAYDNGNLIGSHIGLLTGIKLRLD